MIIEIAGIVAALIITFYMIFMWGDEMAAKRLAETQRADRQIAADRLAHEQYMEVRRLEAPEPSAELLAVRLAEAEARKASAALDKQREYSSSRHH